jgi:hypothetical protein
MTEAQGWVFIGLLALLAFVYLYRTSTDVVRERIKLAGWAILGLVALWFLLWLLSW